MFHRRHIDSFMFSIGRHVRDFGGVDLIHVIHHVMRKMKVYVTAIGQRCLSWTSMAFLLEKVPRLMEPGTRVMGTMDEGVQLMARV